MAEYRTNLDARVQLYLNAYEISTNAAGNYSTVRAELYLVRISGTGRFSVNTNNTWSVNIDGQPGSGSGTYDVRSGQQLKLSQDFNVGHNPDGTKTINVSASFNDPSGNVASGSTGGQLGLTTLPRASKASFPNGSTFDAGSTVQINTNRSSGSFTHDIDYYYGSKSGRALSGISDSGNWSVPMDLLTENPNSSTGSGRIHTKTYNGGTLVGESDTSFTLSTPFGAGPTITNVTSSEATTTPDVANIVGAYVKGITKLNVAISGASAQYGASIASYSISIAGQTINYSSGVTGVINSSGSLNLTGTVVDSRGKARSKTVSVSVLDYAPPAITTATAARALNTGTVDTNGTYIKAALKAAVSSLVNGSQRNNLTFVIKTKQTTDNTAWSSITPVTSVNANAVGFDDFRLINPYPAANSYTVRIEVTDNLAKTTAIELTVGTGGVVIHYPTGVDAIGVGQFYTPGRGSIDAKDFIYHRSGKQVIDLDSLTSFDAGTTNLDTLRSPGYYYQTNTANGIGANSYPVTNITGYLDVRGGLGGTYVVQRFYATDSRVWSRIYNGSSWSSWRRQSQVGLFGTPYAMAQGNGLTSASIANGSSSNVSISFPANTFTLSPYVYGGFDNARLTAGFSSISTTGATMTHANWSTGAAGSGVGYWWLAVQM